MVGRFVCLEKIIMNLGGWVQIFKDCLFPIFCLECQQEGQWWCNECLEKSFKSGVMCCPVCHQANINGHVCQNCKATSFLNGSVAFFNYEESAPIGLLIKKFKFNLATDVSKVWKHIILSYGEVLFDKANWPSEQMVIIPVPLHKKRYNERGFNQSAIIAQLVFEKLEYKGSILFDAKNLLRQKNTAQQARLSRVERLENIKNAFVWQGQKLDGCNIVLVDDVFTTGATMQACAQILKENGAATVFALTLARG